MKQATWVLWGVPLLVFLLIAPFTPWIDLQVADFFYGEEGFIKQSDSHHSFFSLLYKYGNLPGQILSLLAVALFAGSFFFPAWKKWRRGALVVALTAFIGAGILVSGVFKEVWGRARPRQIERFGGIEPFRPFYSPIFSTGGSPYKSFPSGHATMGFLFLSLAFVGAREKSRFLYVMGIVLGLGGGVLLSYVRMAQGGHFFSDILAAGLLMWLVALVCCHLVYAYCRDPH